MWTSIEKAENKDDSRIIALYLWATYWRGHKTYVFCRSLTCLQTIVLVMGKIRKKTTTEETGSLWQNFKPKQQLAISHSDRMLTESFRILDVMKRCKIRSTRWDFEFVFEPLSLDFQCRLCETCERHLSREFWVCSLWNNQFWSKRQNRRVFA